MSDVDFRYPVSTVRKENSQLLTLSSQGHPAYTPIKLNVKTASEMNMKLAKTKAPEKPIVPYMRYSRKVWDQVKAAHPEAKLWEIGKIIGQMWRDLSDVDKHEYICDYENAKADYCEQLKIYHNSPQYQSFLFSMTRKKIGKGYEENIKSSPAIGTNALTNSNILNSMNSSNKLINTTDVLPNFAIEPAEDDGIDDGLTVRHVCAARFNRNHKLINEIFSEYIVPDSRSIITSQRMEQLKKQVTSLELHQEKLKQELQSIEEKNATKKKKFLSSSENFENEINKLKEFKCTDDQIKEIFDKNYDELQKQWKEHMEKLVKEKSINSQNINIKDVLDEIIFSKKNLLSIQPPNQINLIVVQKPLETVTSHSSNVQNPASTNVTQPNIVIQNNTIYHNNSHHQNHMNQAPQGPGSHNISHPNQSIQSNMHNYSTNPLQHQQNMQSQTQQSHQQQPQLSSSLNVPASQQIQNHQVILAPTQQISNQHQIPVSSQQQQQHQNQTIINQQQIQPVINSSNQSSPHINSQQVTPVQQHPVADYSNYQHQQNSQSSMQQQYQLYPQYTSQNTDMQQQQQNHQIYQQNTMFQTNQFNPQYRPMNYIQPGQPQPSGQMQRMPAPPQMAMNVRPIIGAQSQIQSNTQGQSGQTISQQSNQSAQYSSNAFNMQQQHNTQMGNQFRTSNTPPISNQAIASPSQQPINVPQNPNQGSIVSQQQIMQQQINMNQSAMINRIPQQQQVSQQTTAQLQMRQSNLPIPQQAQTPQQPAQAPMVPQQQMMGYYTNQGQQNYYSTVYPNQIIPSQQNQMVHYSQNTMNTPTNSQQYPQPAIMQGQMMYPSQPNMYGMPNNQSQMIQQQPIMNSQYLYQQTQQQQQIHNTPPPPPQNQTTSSNNLSPSNTTSEKTKSKKKTKAAKNVDSTSDK